MISPARSQPSKRKFASTAARSPHVPREEQAERLAAMLKEVAAAGEADRGKLIGEHLDRWTDNAAAAERFAELKTLSGPLRTSGCTLFVLAFIVGPALYLIRLGRRRGPS